MLELLATWEQIGRKSRELNPAVVLRLQLKEARGVRAPLDSHVQ